MDFPFPRFYAILDPGQMGNRPCFGLLEALLQAGVRLVQYRDKEASSQQLFDAGAPMARRSRQAGGTFIMNDRADVALAVDAGGVHLGQDDLPVEGARLLLPRGKLIGVSTHSLDQVEKADRSPADYIAFGPIFATGSKNHPDAVVGLEGLAQARKITRKPLVAIGGITLERARAVMESGADSIAVIHALVSAPDPAERTSEFLDVIGR
jgi:thiamine-phosphate pyrophosphorylase